MAKTKTIAAVLDGKGQAKIARRLGVSQGAVSRWIAGRRRPRDPKVRALLVRWGVDPRHV